MIKRKVETMTTNELIDLFRDYGIPCSYESVVAHIEQGNFPFACCARKGGAGRHQFLIFKKQALEWLEERVSEVGA